MSVFPFALFVSAALMTQAAAVGTAEQFAARVQQRYDTIRDFEADFVQSYQGGLLKTKTSERGTVAIKRPGRMRWLYTRPERKEFVSDGTRIYSYLPTDKQVIVSPVPKDQTTPALFLTGTGHLVRDFTVTFADLSSLGLAPPKLASGSVRAEAEPAAPKLAPGSVRAEAGPRVTALKLVPKRPDPDVEWLILGVDSATLQLRQLVAADRQGGRSSFTFTNLKENRGLSDKIFEFRIPRGVDVVTSGVPSK